MLGFSPLASATLADTGAVAAVQYSLTADAGSFALAVQAAGFTKDVLIDLAAGSFALAGQDVNLSVSEAFETGSFALSGQDVSFEVGEFFGAGGFLLTGQDAGLIKSVKLSLNAGSFSSSGQDANLKINRVISAEAGAFALTGQATSFTKATSVSLDAGSFTLTGSDIDLIISEGAGTGLFTLNGQDATFHFAFNRRFEFDGYSQEVVLKDNNFVIIEEAYKEAA